MKARFGDAHRAIFPDNSESKRRSPTTTHTASYPFITIRREDGRDLVAEKRKARADNITFRESALTYLETHKHQWTNTKHADQWLNTMETYAFPAIGSKPVGSITAGEIIAAISEVWTTKPETGRRVRQRICAVLDYAYARGWRGTEAPARSLAVGRSLPKQSGGKHHAAMPYSNVPAFLTRLRASGGVWGRLALEFVILTAARSQEARLAKWSEFDVDNGLWTVPAGHMKMRHEILCHYPRQLWPCCEAPGQSGWRALI